MNEKEKCTDKEWQHCRVEKMGCKGCHYDKFNNLEIANEFANLTFIYGGKIAFTSEQLKGYQNAVKKIIERNEFDEPEEWKIVKKRITYELEEIVDEGK